VTVTSAPVTGQTITLGVGSQSCPGVTNSSGIASCTLNLDQASGSYTATASFAGAGLFLASSASAPFTITREEDTLTYTGDTVIANNTTAHLSGVLLEDGVVPIAGRTVMFTLGTGVGGAVVIGDTVIEGEHSHGGELGHLRIDMPDRGRRCGCGALGCLEAYASATAVVKRAHDALAQDGGKSSLHRTLKERGRITSEDIFNAAAAGDAVSDKLVEDTAFYLAVGATNMMHTIDPDMVVYAGGMIAAGEPFLDRIRRHVKQLAFPVPAEKTQIRYAQLGGDAGFIGAAACGRQLFYKSPTTPPRSASR